MQNKRNSLNRQGDYDAAGLWRLEGTPQLDSRLQNR